jgi:hypothetical protein
VSVSQPVEQPVPLDGLAPAPAAVEVVAVPEDAAPPLTGLAAEVHVRRMQALLIGRPPDCLTDPDARPLVDETVRGIATEVAAITGSDPAGEVRDLALWAIVLGSAASLEAALFPEGTGIGDTGRAEVLQRRYLGVLADLRRATTAGITGGNFSGLVHVGRGGWPA